MSIPNISLNNAYGNYSSYGNNFSYGNYSAQSAGRTGMSAQEEEEAKKKLPPALQKEEEEKDSLKKTGHKSSPEDCETCKNRKYQDGSDEMVSFKSASHISPEASAARVRGHEQEHVSNAYKDAAQNNGKVVNCNVSLKTAVCPECGRSYVAGGTTSTQIKYYNEENPYQKNLKQTDALKYRGNAVDLAG